MRRPFNPDMLAVARDARGFTQAELVGALDGAMSQAKLSKIENGLVQPADAEVDTLARALNFRSAFFYHGHQRRAEPTTYHRKRQKLPRKDWAQTYAKAEIYRIAASLFLKSVEVTPRAPAPPAIDLDQYNGDATAAARSIRQLWAMPRGPVDDVTSYLENAGIVVFAFDFGTDLCDGFCQQPTDGMPPSGGSPV